MKRILLLIFLLINIVCFSQAISVNTTTYTADQLINKVLINSPCVSGNNVTVKDGALFGSTNSIGYFENTNSNFPFTKGVVLTTGNINKVPSPNNTILSDGNSSWTGDADLEASLLLQSGIKMKSINASYIEFDFQPKTPNFDFSFLFASEEYGTAQCNFSDAFAFLLKDITMGSPSVNLAVIPNTNIPVSVETIRDGAYNTGCFSANPEYFGAFNGEGFGPAINFNGQTVKMIASASGLDINHIYRIKLVIADGGNNTEYDSAIFLEANSFNIGQNVLGLDYTAANNKAICPGATLPTLSASGLKSGTTFVWKKEGIAFSPAQTGSTLNLNLINPLLTSGIHNYSVTYTEPGCIAIKDDIVVEVYPTIGVLATVPDIFTCENGAGSYNFDLNKNRSVIMAGANTSTPTDDLPVGTSITYHLTKVDAETNVGLIANSHSISKAENGKTIYVRIKSPKTPCYEIRSFQLKIVNGPEITQVPDPVTLCARNFTDSPIRAVFNLSDQKAKILGVQSPEYNIITFHSTQNGANTNKDIINTAANGDLLSPTQTIWVRLQNISNIDCYSTTSFQLNVTPIPLVDVLPNVAVCEYYILPELTIENAHYFTETRGGGTPLFPGDKITKTSTIFIYNDTGICKNQSSFVVTIIDLGLITPATASYCSEYKLPILPFAKYYTLSGGKNTPGNKELAGGTTINKTGINQLYVWFEDTTVSPVCSQEKTFAISIIPFVSLPTYKDQFVCNSYTLPVDPNGGIYYYGPNQGLPILPAGTIITETQTIHVFKESGTSPKNCSSENSFKVNVGVTNITAPKDIESCSTYILPKLTIGEYRTAPAGGGSLVAEGTAIKTTTTLWFHVTGLSCTDDMKFTINVIMEPLPEMPPVRTCDIYYLPSVNHAGNYYSGPLGTGKMFPVGSQITSTQKMYFFDKAPVGKCFQEKSFLITIIPSALLDAKPVEVLKCGERYILDDLKNGEYYEFPGGPSPTNPILPPGHVISTSKTIYAYAPAIAPITCESEYSIKIDITLVNEIEDQYACNTYSLPAIIGPGDYYTEKNGPYGTGVKLLPPYAPITSTTTLYVYLENNNRVSCYDEEEFKVTIYNTPIVEPIIPVTACESYALPEFTAPATRYFTQAGGPGNINNKELYPNDIISNSTSVYVYAEVGSPSTVICYDEKPMEITIVRKPKPTLTIPPICVNKITGMTSYADIISGYDPTRYSFEWKKADGTLVGTGSDFSTNVAGNYTFQLTSLAVSTGCPSDPLPFTVLNSSNPENVTFTTNGWFSDDQKIVINALPYAGYSNNFTYSLDGSAPQTSNIFTNVASGTHEITVSDAYGCGASTSIPIQIKLVSSPRYFTPNGDGINDKWNITELGNQTDVKIFIFDRYGKLLKQLFPNGEGWDGTFIGQLLPADDYWFTVYYAENGVNKEYKSHFSLTR